MPLAIAEELAGFFSWRLSLPSLDATFSPNTERVLGFSLAADADSLLGVIHPDDRPAVVDAFDRVVRGDAERLDVECRFLAPDDGATVWVEVRGRLADGDAFIGVTQNITGRKSRELDAAFLVRLGDAIQSIVDPAEVEHRATGLLAGYLGADRVAYAEYPRQGPAPFGSDAVHVAAPPIGAGTLQAYGQALLDGLASGRTVVLADTRNDPAIDADQQSRLEVGATRALVAAPLVKAGRLRGVLAVHQAEPRAWTGHEVAIVEEAAERIWSAVEYARAEHALDATRTELARQARLLDTTLSSVGHFVFVWNREKRFVYANRKLEELWGLAPGAYRDKTTAELGYPPELTERFDRQIEQVIESRAAVSGEVPYTSPSGVFGYYDYVFSPVIGADGQVDLVAGVAHDSTERRHAEEERERLLRDVEIERERLAAVFQQAPSLMAVLRGPDHVFEQANPPVHEWYGGGDLIGKPIREALPDFERQGYVEVLDRVYQTGEPFSATGARVVRPSRSGDPRGERYVDVVFRALRDANGTVTGVLAQAVDVTERIQAETDRGRLASIVEYSRDAVFGYDLDGLITDWNPAATALLGFPAAEIVGRHVSVLADPRGGQVSAMLDRLREGEDIPAFETALVRRDGGRVEVELRQSAVRDAGERVIGVAAIARDVSARKQMERAQEDFMAMASHDLRSPITVLSGQAQLMKRRRAYDEHRLDIILEQARRIERLVSDLQAVVSIEAGGVELRRGEMDLVALARSEVDRLRSGQTGHRVRLELAEAEITGAWDHDRLSQVLDNLLGNAVKYSPDGGEIVVRVERVDDEVRVSVTDQGEGLPSGVLPHLFERFYRAGRDRASPGLGLGLYISRMLVEAHGGRIWARSTQGEGSTFTFALPAAR